MLDLSKAEFRITGVLSPLSAALRTAAIAGVWVGYPAVTIWVVLSAEGIGWLLALAMVGGLAALLMVLANLLRTGDLGALLEGIRLIWATEHAVWVEGEALCFGYRAFGKRTVQHRAPAAAIIHLHLGPGAASLRTKTDREDWSVSVWYDRDGETTLAWTSPPGSEPDALAWSRTLETLLGAHTPRPVPCTPLPEGDAYQRARYS